MGITLSDARYHYGKEKWYRKYIVIYKPSPATHDFVNKISERVKDKNSKS